MRLDKFTNLFFALIWLSSLYGVNWCKQNLFQIYSKQYINNRTIGLCNKQNLLTLISMAQLALIVE